MKKIKYFIQTYENFVIGLFFFLLAWPFVYATFVKENPTYHILFYVITALYLVSNIIIFVLTYNQNKKKLE
jgi:divalent metal cation (Fe/Co/Zn/Cd) transporter